MKNKSGRSAGDVTGKQPGHYLTRIFNRLNHFTSGLFGAIQDHHNWVDSLRARALEEWSERIAVVLLYGAYLAGGFLAYRLWLDFTSLATRIHAAPPTDLLDARTGLFYIFAASFLIPAGLFVAWFIVKWVYRLSEAGTHRLLPRFTRVLFYPVVLCLVAVLVNVYRTPIAASLAHTYAQARTTVAAATLRPSRQMIEELPLIVQTEGPDARLIEELRKRHNAKRPESELAQE